MVKCMIITSYIDDEIGNLAPWNEADFIICADGGYSHAQEENIRPDLLIGDFDSYRGVLPTDIEILRVNAEKDDTDTGLCLDRAIQMGFREIAIIGGIGGRFDHSIANVQLLSRGLGSGVKITIYSKQNVITMLSGGSISIKKRDGWKLSLFSHSDTCSGVCVSGVFYPLDNAVLHSNFPLGISNEFVEDTATVSVAQGKLLIILSKD